MSYRRRVWERAKAETWATAKPKEPKQIAFAVAVVALVTIVLYATYDPPVAFEFVRLAGLALVAFVVVFLTLLVMNVVLAPARLAADDAEAIGRVRASEQARRLQAQAELAALIAEGDEIKASLRDWNTATSTMGQSDFGARIDGWAIRIERTLCRHVPDYALEFQVNELAGKPPRDDWRAIQTSYVEQRQVALKQRISEIVGQSSSSPAISSQVQT